MSTLLWDGSGSFLSARGFLADSLGICCRDYWNYILLGVLYLLAVAGIHFFAVGPFLRSDSVTSAAFKAGFAGLIFSSGGVCADYFAPHTEPLWLYLAQIIWLPVMMATTAAITVWAGKRMKG